MTKHSLPRPICDSHCPVGFDHRVEEDAQTYELGVTRVTVTFKRYVCMSPGCGKVWATEAQSAGNQERLRKALPRVKLAVTRDLFSE